MRYTSLLLLATLLIACADEPNAPPHSVLPGLQSSYVWTRTITSSDPALVPRTDTLNATVEGYLAEYQGEEGVAQISTSEGIVYMKIDEEGGLSTRERVIFPGLLLGEPLWLRWPFGGARQELALLDTSGIGPNRLTLRVTWSGRPSGRREVKLLGRTFEGFDLDYTFRYEVEEEELVRVVEGSATWIPSLGWRSTIDETHLLISSGDTVSTTHRVDRLVNYVLTPIP